MLFILTVKTNYQYRNFIQNLKDLKKINLYDPFDNWLLKRLNLYSKNIELIFLKILYS